MAESTTTSGTEVQSGIAAVNRRFMDTYQRGDAAGMPAFYTDDAVLLPPGSPMVRGADGIRQAFQGMMDSGAERVELRTEQLETAGDTAYEVGAATVHIRLPDGGTIQDPGKYVVVWKRQGGEWKIHVDMFNSDSPPPQS